MLLKLNRLLIAIFLCMFFITPQIVPQGSYIWATEKCEFVSVDKSKPLFETTLSSQYIKGKFSAIPQKYSDRKKMGILGEIVAKEAIEKKNWGGKRRVSITTMFENKDCEIISYLRDKADRGIDDIFVVLREDGWIDQRYHPVFHESKYDGRCNLKLKETMTLCTQLSFQWLEGNLQKANKRTTQANLCVGDSGFLTRSCQDCKKMFQENISWLARMLKEGNFIRTASVLCADRRLSIYAVNGS